MESFPLSLEQFRYVRKHRKNLEKRFQLKFFLPEVYNLTCTLANVTGEKRNIKELQDLLNKKVPDNKDNPSTSHDVPVITLSDSDSETDVCLETPIKQKNKKKKKRNLESCNISTPLAARELAKEGNSSEIEVLDDETAPASKRARSGPASPTEEYIPLSVTKSTDGVRSVKIKPNSQSSLKAANQEKSNSSCVGTTSSVFATSNTCETDVVSSQDDSVRIIEDTFLLDNKPSSTSTAPCETHATCTLDDSVMIVDDSARETDDSARETDDSIRIIEDCFVLDTKPSLPKENGTTVLDDSIVEIAIPEDRNQQTSQSNTGFQLTPVLTNHSNNHNSSKANNFPSLARIFSREYLISLNRPTVHQSIWANPFQQIFVTNHNHINNGLQNTASGSNLIMTNGLVPPVLKPTTLKLRPVVIDGSNVARSHGLTTNTYSCKGIKICVDYFVNRGHTEITVFMPKFRKHKLYGPFPTTDADILEELEKAGKLAYSPSRIVNGQRQCSYDDRFVVKLAAENGGVIVSNDYFRDIMLEREDYKKTIEERLLMYCFVGDKIMFPDDPFGRGGPCLTELLAFPPE